MYLEKTELKEFFSQIRCKGTKKKANAQIFFGKK